MPHLLFSGMLLTLSLCSPLREGQLLPALPPVLYLRIRSSLILRREWGSLPPSMILLINFCLFFSFKLCFNFKSYILKKTHTKKHVKFNYYSECLGKCHRSRTRSLPEPRRALCTLADHRPSPSPIERTQHSDIWYNSIPRFSLSFTIYMHSKSIKINFVLFWALYKWNHIVCILWCLAPFGVCEGHSRYYWFR